MTAQPAHQFRIDKNIRDLKNRDAKKFTTHQCPVCGFRRRMAQINGDKEPGCSTECNNILLKERKAKARRAQALRFMAWKQDLDAGMVGHDLGISHRRHAHLALGVIACSG